MISPASLSHNQHGRHRRCGLIDFGISLSWRNKNFLHNIPLNPLCTLCNLFFHHYNRCIVLTRKKPYMSIFEAIGGGFFETGMNPASSWGDLVCRLLCVKHALILTLFGNYVNKITAKPCFTVISIFLFVLFIRKLI